MKIVTHAAGDPPAGGVAAPHLPGLTRRNPIHFQRGLLDLLGSLESDSRGDSQLRAFALARLGEIDDALAGRGDASAGTAAG